MLRKSKVVFLFVLVLVLTVVGSVYAKSSVEPPWPWMKGNVEDSTDLPDWTRSQLELTFWNAHGAGGDEAVKPTPKDVIFPEIKRVTGVSIDFDNTFDNAGQSADVRLGMLAAAADWPDIVFNPGFSGGISKLAENGLVYDLTELIPKYCPNLLEKMSFFYPDLVKEYKPELVDKLEGIKDRVGVKTAPIDKTLRYDDRVYGLVMGLDEGNLHNFDPTLDQSLFAYFSNPFEPREFIWVRDDILTKIYPEAKTQAQIEELYMKKGKFTREELFDVPIKNAEDFINFLYDIKELEIKENGQEVSPFYVFSGGDNWPLMTVLQSALYGRKGSNYFCYWDTEKQKIEYTFKQSFFKEELLTWNELVRDEVAAKESLVDSYGQFDEKINNGLYAVSYAWLEPDNSLLEQQGKSYRYRKVYFDIPMDKKYLGPRLSRMPRPTIEMAFFKDELSQDELIQVLRWIDYLASDIGEKMLCWGPRDAGIWEVKDGQKYFTNKEIEEFMVYGKANKAGIEYNLNNGYQDMMGSYKWGNIPTVVRYNRSKFHPAVNYDREKNKSEADLFFSSAMVLEPPRQVVSQDPRSLWVYGDYIEECKKAWKARQSFEDALLKTLAAADDEQFDLLYNEFISLTERIGYTEDLLEEINRVFREEINKDLMENLLSVSSE